MLQNRCCMYASLSSTAVRMQFGAFLTIQMSLFKNHLVLGPHKLVHSVNTIQDMQVLGVSHNSVCSHATIIHIDVCPTVEQTQNNLFKGNTPWSPLLNCWAFYIRVLVGNLTARTFSKFTLWGVGYATVWQTSCVSNALHVNFDSILMQFWGLIFEPSKTPEVQHM